MIDKVRSPWVKDDIFELQRIRDVPMQRSGMFRMDRNERTWRIPEEIIETIKSRISSETLTNYPEMDGIYHKLANYLNVDYEQIYFHSGSDLVIKSIFETYIGKGDRLLLQNPSYAMYEVYGRMYGAEIVEHDYDDDLTFDMDKYCNKIETLHPKVVILENPSGYIGNSYSIDKVGHLIDVATNNNALVLVDEAYIDYIPEASALDLLPMCENLIIVRTFSKAWGLAGMRAGYAVSNDLIISEIFKTMPMHELTSAAIIAVDTMLDNVEFMHKYIDEVSSVREYFLDELDKLRIKAVRSDTHFVTTALGEFVDSDDFRKRAHNNKFFVRRPFRQHFLRNWVRIGLLPMDEMEMFVTFLKSYLKEA